LGGLFSGKRRSGPRLARPRGQGRLRTCEFCMGDGTVEEVRVCPPRRRAARGSIRLVTSCAILWRVVMSDSRFSGNGFAAAAESNGHAAEWESIVREAGLDGKLAEDAAARGAALAKPQASCAAGGKVDPMPTQSRGHGTQDGLERAKGGVEADKESVQRAQE